MTTLTVILILSAAWFALAAWRRADVPEAIDAGLEQEALLD